MLELVRLVQEHGGRLVLSGDTRQHGPVEASDAMLALERYACLKPAELRKIRRQNPKLGRADNEKRAIRRYRRAVVDAAAGKLAESFAALEQLGAIKACPFGDQAARLAEEYLRTAQAGHTQVVVAQTWNEVNRVNDCVRSRLREKGLLGNQETQVEAIRACRYDECSKARPALLSAKCSCGVEPAYRRGASRCSWDIRHQRGARRLD